PAPRSVLDHHRRRLHDRGRGHPLAEIELLDSIAGDDGDEPDGVGDDHLHLGHEALDLDVGDDGVEPVASAEMGRSGIPARALSLARRDAPAVALVAGAFAPSLPVPTPKSVDADAESLRGFTDAVVLAGHGSGTVPRQVLACNRQPSCSAAPAAWCGGTRL